MREIAQPLLYQGANAKQVDASQAPAVFLRQGACVALLKEYHGNLAEIGYMQQVL